MRFTRYFRWLILVLAISVVAGCKTDKGKVAKIARVDSGLMSEQWEPISPFESGMSIRDEQDKVLQRVAKRNANQKVYSEAMKLANGNMLFERRKAVSVEAFHPAEQELVRRYNKSSGFKQLGIQLLPENLRQQAHAEGDITYAVEQGGGYKCVAFFRYSKASRVPTAEEDGFYEAISGASCLPVGSKDAASLENDILDLAGRVVFDNGRLSRTKLFAAGLAQLEKDARGPEIVVPYSVSTQNATVTLEGQLKDETGLKSLSWEKGDIEFGADGTFKVELPVPDGKSKITLIALDTLGNRSTVDVFVVRGKLEEDVTPGKSYALLFGVQKYQDSRIPSLDTAISDVRAVAKVLTETYKYEVKIVENSNRAQMVEEIEREKSRLQENDNFLIYYSGHGIQDKNGRGYWVPSDGAPDSSDLWLSNSDVVSQLRAMPSRRILMVSDSCFSGTLTAQKVTQAPTIRTARSRTAISSGGIEPVSDDDGSGHSPFARHFMDVLREKTGDVTDFGVYNKVKRLVMRDSNQEPQYGAIPVAGHVLGSGYYF